MKASLLEEETAHLPRDDSELDQAVESMLTKLDVDEEQLAELPPPEQARPLAPIPGTEASKDEAGGSELRPGVDPEVSLLPPDWEPPPPNLFQRAVDAVLWRLPPLPEFDPSSRTWRLASIPLAAAAVILALLLLQGDDDEAAPPAGSPGAAAGVAQGAGGKEGEGHLVKGDTYTLELPPGWTRIDGASGAAFAAASADGTADATLWVSEDPKLDFPSFVNRSMAQLEALAGSARVVGRVPAPTPEETIVRLAADSPPGEPTYEVTLRAAGPYRYYLATSVRPGAGAEAAEGADLIAASLAPQADDAQG